MIRIKDYILNENDIKVIENDEDLLTIIFKDGSYRETQGTFDDIEWNYGDDSTKRMVEEFRKTKEELEELKLDYSAVVTSYKKLEEGNKKYEKKFNTAAKYIKIEANYNDFLGDVTAGLSANNCSELLQIIDGE